VRFEDVADVAGTLLAEDDEVGVHRLDLLAVLVGHCERPLLARVVAQPADDVLVLEHVGQNLVKGFCDAVDQDPVETLGLHPLLQYQREGGKLEHGQLLSVYPPFSTKESEEGVDLRAISSAERLDALAHMAAVLSGFKDGQQVEFRV
jgi:hypothetical protein